MTKKKKNKSKINITAVICIIFLVVLLLGSATAATTHAFWVLTRKQESSNKINTGCLQIDFNDKDANENVLNINLLNAYPVDDIAGINSTPYTFTITNTCSLKAGIKVYLHTLSSSTMNSDYIKFNFSDLASNSSYTKSLYNLSSDSVDPLYLDEIVTKVGNISSSYALVNTTLNPEASVTYDLKIWISESAPNSIMGSSYNAAVSASAYPVK